jgi:cytochrome c-type biogenesis protein CcmH/NrfG
MRTALITRYSANARGALARQDLDGAISNWQKVLELDPENGNARLELDRVRGLKEKLQNLK